MSAFASIFISLYFIIIAPYFQVLTKNTISMGGRPGVLLFIMLLGALLALALKKSPRPWQRGFLAFSISIVSWPLMYQAGWETYPWPGAILFALLWYVLRLIDQKPLFETVTKTFAVVLLAWSGFLFYKNAPLIFREEVPRTTIPQSGLQAKSKLPNIHHFILDSASGAQLPKGFSAWEGFTTYPRSYTSYAQTRHSLRAILTGKPVPENDLKRNLNPFSETFFHYLKDDYQILTNFKQIGDLPSDTVTFDFTTMVDPRMSPTRLFLLDVFNFFRTYRFQYWPVSKEDHIVDMQPFNFGREVWGLEQLAKSEANYPAEGTYRLIYLFAPHVPAYLNANCEYHPLFLQTKYLEQYECILGNIGKYLAELKRLGRYDASMIIIHGDHGASAHTLDRHKPLLLVKLPGAKERVVYPAPIAVTSVPNIISRAVKPFPWPEVDSTKERFFYHNIRHQSERGFSIWKFNEKDELVPIQMK